MKKITILVVIVLLSILKINNYDGLLYKEIDIYDISSIVGSNLYEEAKAVAAIPVDVLDYELKEEGLYIKTINNRIILPFDGVVTTFKNNFIELDTNYGIISIYGDIKCNYRLYQYYYHNTILGSGKEFTLVSDNYSSIVSNLRINYETV
ncbi:MAG: hypothetical protein ACI35S_07775 [Anaeroplasma sp.]